MDGLITIQAPQVLPRFVHPVRVSLAKGLQAGGVRRPSLLFVLDGGDELNRDFQAVRGQRIRTVEQQPLGNRVDFHHASSLRPYRHLR